MKSMFVLAQAAPEPLGWLSGKLLGVTLTRAEWVLCKTLTSRTTALGHALVGSLRSEAD
jgi:hypothetical protein